MTAAGPLPRALHRLRARPVRRAAFVSDLHLHGGDPAGVRRAVDFLESMAERPVDAVFLLGDVFRAWLGPQSCLDPGLQPFLDSLRDLVARGLWVVLLHGNHDFIMGKELSESCGVDVVSERLALSLGGQRVLLSHGDRFCTRDLDYQRLHRVLRSRALRWLWSVAPPAALSWVAGKLLRESSRATAGKPQELMAIVDRAVKRELAEGADVVLCGHVHRARDAILTVGKRRGRLLVMADFETTGSHALFEQGRWTLVAADPAWAPSAPPVVAIDGPAGCGKSSVSRALARRLGWVRLDSGALYRAFTLAALEQGLSASDEAALTALAEGLELALDRRGGVTLEGRAVPDEQLRSAAVSRAVSPMSAVAGVRAALLGAQRQMGLGQPGLVAEGRDMATVVFPQATLAVYLDARVEVRAARRMAQNPGEGRTLAEVSEALSRRDGRDSRRSTAPLTRASGAVLLDTSDLDLEQVVEQLGKWLAERLGPDEERVARGP